MWRRFSRLRNLARERWDAVLASPGGGEHVARGAAAGAFAAMIPAFGLHLALALGAALLARGSLSAAAASCLLIGNPLVHALELPLAFELGRWLIPAGEPGLAWLPAWMRTLLPIAEEAFAGGALLGATVAVPAYFGVRRALTVRAARRVTDSSGARRETPIDGADPE
jgi:uncharacterized protein